MSACCEICGSIQNLDHHHVIPKRMGGSKNPAVHGEGNLTTLCRGCHRNVHEGRWELVRSQEGIRVLDKDTGEQVMRRLYNLDLDIPSLFQLLNLAADSLSRLHQALPYLTDEQLVEAFAYASSFGKRSWLVQAAILYEAQQRAALTVNAPWRLLPVASRSDCDRLRSTPWSGRSSLHQVARKKTSILTQSC